MCTEKDYYWFSDDEIWLLRAIHYKRKRKHIHTKDGKDENAILEKDIASDKYLFMNQ